MSGWLWAHHLLRINPDLFTSSLSLWFLAMILFALVVIFFILIEPKGLYHRLERIKLYFRLNPFAY